MHNRSRTDRLGVNGGEFRSRNAFELGPEFFGKIGKRGQMPGEDGVVGPNENPRRDRRGLVDARERAERLIRQPPR